MCDHRDCEHGLSGYCEECEKETTERRIARQVYEAFEEKMLVSYRTSEVNPFPEDPVCVRIWEDFLLITDLFNKGFFDREDRHTHLRKSVMRHVSTRKKAPYENP